MKASTLFGVSLLSFVLPALADPHAHHGRRHGEVARRVPGDLAKRAPHTNARYSWYDVGLGACGATNVETDFIVALNADEFGSGYPGPNCFKMITISYGGKTTQAQITDRCPGCPYGGLDMSKGLFQFFTPLGTGIFYGTWSYNDDAAVTTTAQATPTSTWVAPTTSTSVWVAPTTSTSVWVAPPTTSSTWVAPTTSSSTWKPDTTSASSSTPAPAPTTAASTSEHRSSSRAESASAPAESSSAHADAGASASSSAPGAAPSAVRNDDAASVLDAFGQVAMGLGGLVVAGART